MDVAERTPLREVKNKKAKIRNGTDKILSKHDADGARFVDRTESEMSINGSYLL